MEAVDEEAHVVTVGVGGFIARVALKLHLGSQTRKRLVCHHPSPRKAGRRIAVGTPILERLNTAATFVEYDGMEVDFAIHRSSQFEACWSLIQRDFISQPLKRLQGRVRTAKFNDNVEVVVFSCLPSQ